MKEPLLSLKKQQTKIGFSYFQNAHKSKHILWPTLKIVF